MGGQARFDSSDRDDAGKMRGDLGRRTAMLNRVQQIVHKRAIYAPLMQRAFINGQGKRVDESALGQILGHPYSAPYEDLTIKQT
jgi:peptide/nickel transport system substrate-binding protein